MSKKKRDRWHVLPVGSPLTASHSLYQQALSGTWTVIACWRRVREGKVLRVYQEIENELKEVRVNLVQKEERKGNKIDMPLTAYD